jgi:hypothetical protein
MPVGDIRRSSPGIDVMRAFHVLLVLVATTFLCGAENGPAPLEITADTTLDPQKTYGAIVIRKSDITIDGGGAWLIGAKAGNPK